TSFSYVLLRLNRRLQTESTAPRYRIANAGSLLRERLLDQIMQQRDRGAHRRTADQPAGNRQLLHKPRRDTRIQIEVALDGRPVGQLDLGGRGPDAERLGAGIAGGDLETSLSCYQKSAPYRTAG
ncbi:MAG: hypothetical protein MZV65_45405, partial [Chromatiales bacterium]|nr:hypothetical protein [Chromatiales bacterium]